MKLKKMFYQIAIPFLLFGTLSASAMSDNSGDKNNSIGEEVENTYDTAVNKTKEAYREIKDETCEMINGKMECAAQEVKHKAENLKDDAEDEIEDM